MSYAKGRRAVGECGKSGRKMLLRKMTEDGYYKNLKVDPDWYDGRHPQEQLPAVRDPIALRDPAPEKSTDNRSVTIRFPLYDVSTGETTHHLSGGAGIATGPAITVS